MIILNHDISANMMLHHHSSVIPYINVSHLDDFRIFRKQRMMMIMLSMSLLKGGGNLKRKRFCRGKGMLLLWKVN